MPSYSAVFRHLDSQAQPNICMLHSPNHVHIKSDTRKCYTNILRELRSLREGKSVRYDLRDELARTRHIRFPNPLGAIVLLLQRECGYALLYSGILCCSFYVTLSLMPSQEKYMASRSCRSPCVIFLSVWEASSPLSTGGE